MPYRVTVTARFEAAHNLIDYAGGPEPLHGHSYRVDLRLDQQTSPRRRARLRSRLAEYLDRHLDHRDLNAVLEFQPTSELLAEHLCAWTLNQANAREAAAVQAVRVWESPRRWAEFTQDDRSGR